MLSRQISGIYVSEFIYRRRAAAAEKDPIEAARMKKVIAEANTALKVEVSEATAEAPHRSIEENHQKQKQTKKVSWEFPAVTRVEDSAGVFSIDLYDVLPRVYGEHLVEVQPSKLSRAQRAWQQTKLKLKSLVCCINKPARKEDTYMVE